LEKDFADYPLLSTAANAPEIMVFDSVQSRTKPEFRLFQKAGVSAAVAIPLRVNDRPLGLLCFATWSREAIAAEETELLTTIAQYLATAVDRENTNHQLRKATNQLTNHAQLLEEKVAEPTSQLQETISELETFSYTLAHDLKAPIRALTGYCQVLLEDYAEALPDGAKRIVKRLGRISQRMETLTRELLKFTRVSRQNIILSAVEIAPIIEEILNLRDPAVRQAITLRSPLHAVRANPALLQHVISNLVDNAVKFVEAGRAPNISIYTEVMAHFSPNTRSRSLLFSSTEPSLTKSVTKPLELSARQIRIWVVDEGIGIPIEAHQKIFGIFERGATAEAYEGTGMGLAIVARAVQRMSGTCGVESEPKKGSRFWVQLPAA
jgi:signal transduction histidine kinase